LANIFRALREISRIFKSMKIYRMQSSPSLDILVEWNASCVSQFWRRFRHRTQYEKKYERATGSHAWPV